MRISGIRDGVLFLPFHYGYWDTKGGHEPDKTGRAANELTITDWDPASKQPIFKTAAASIRKLKSGKGRPSAAPTTTASAPVKPVGFQTSGTHNAAADENISATPVGGSR